MTLGTVGRVSICVDITFGTVSSRGTEEKDISVLMGMILGLGRSFTTEGTIILERCVNEGILKLEFLIVDRSGILGGIEPMEDILIGLDNAGLE